MFEIKLPEIESCIESYMDHNDMKFELETFQIMRSRFI